MSVACVRHMYLSPPELHRGVYCRHFCIPCTLIHSEVHIQTITTSGMQTTRTALVGLLSDDETDYRSDIDHFVSWCVANCLELNVVKTKELVIDFRSGVYHPTPVNINMQNIEIVHSYKYLGTTIDDKLRWDENTMNLYKKGQQRLYFLRKLNALHIDRTFYLCSTIHL